ncbi:hypothetical protein CKN80_02795 [Carnobacterium divergens]|uniref:WxL domain-containing protein n=1 Tax=Carnobacterium divergens TaxID=2748 RepID=UPI001072DED5|nr:WxL domain-containing protein [Carnobacterium divergens]TFJ46683.1 hypothetical protein CKN79_02790 [Carnobacterium divergens]TFJ53647.1 hypothetical protein CKN80_02795 [Carnobacterium divergens]
MRKLNVSCLLLTILGFGTPAFAESTGVVDFEDDTDVMSPVNPLNPSELGMEDPNNPSTNNPGPLSLNVAPLQFDFGVKTMKDSVLSYSTKDVGTQFIQVTDNRTDANGWVLIIQRNELVSKENTEIKGAKLTIPKGILRNSLHVPASNSAEDEHLKTYKVEVYGDNTPVTILSADQINNNGKATTISAWESSKVQLTFKTIITKKGSYTSTINWSLLTAPTS